MSVLAAWKRGLARVARAPWLIVGVWLATVLVALPPMLLLRAAMADHLGASLAGAGAAAGVNFDWWNEFLAQTRGLGRTFVPAVMGFAAVLSNISAVADAVVPPAALAPIVFANALLSIFLLGGILDRLARDRRTGSYGFFASSGVFFFRFLRLGAIAALVYGGLFVTVHAAIFERLYPALTRDTSVERTAFAYRMALYAVFAILVLFFNLLFDYAKIRMVVEDRRSAIGAISAAGRFIRRQPGAAASLYLLNAAGFLVLVAVYYLVAPGPAGGAWILVGFAISQLYVVLRIVVRLLFAASQIALFQGRLAHAGYTARPAPSWPDSPAAEAIRALD